MCEQVTVPALHGPVSISSEHMTRALAPMVHALCVCTREGDEVRAVARLVPSEGWLSAEVIGHPAVDECVQNTLTPHYSPFEASSDCIACGPRRHDVFHGPAPAPAPAATLSYPLTFVHALSHAPEDDQSP